MPALPNPKVLSNIVVFGGTGVQGLAVVKVLAQTGNYHISVLTRDATKPNVIKLAEEHKVSLIEGSYTTESGLRAAFAGQDVCYFNLDSFSASEAEEYFWTFRAYEIAVQSGLKWFIYSGATDRFAKYGYDEKYRNSHNIVGSRLSGWLASQPLERLPWTIIHGGVYAEMLSTLLRPVVEDSGTVVFKAPMGKDSVIPLLPVEMYGWKVLWALRNPVQSVGRFLECSAWQMTYPEIAKALEKTADVETAFEEVTTEKWMEDTGARLGISPEATLPRFGTSEYPPLFTFRKSFAAWWALWRDNRGSLADPSGDNSWVQEVYPDELKSLQEWMTRTGYPKSLGIES